MAVIKNDELQGDVYDTRASSSAHTMIKTNSYIYI